MALSMGEQLGKPFVVENRPGATGTIGAGAVKRAPADGYTLLVASLGPFVVTPHLVKNVPYDAGKDFDYITIPVQAPNVLVASPAQKARTVAEVIAALKANPARSVSRARATAPRTICRPSCSGSKAAPKACTFPTRAAPRPSPT